MSSDPQPQDLAKAEAAVHDQRQQVANGGAQHRLALANALHALGLALEQADRGSEALAAARESVATLAADFLAHPAEFATQIRASIAQYVALAGRQGAKPDEGLLAPLAQALGDLQQSEDDD